MGAHCALGSLGSARSGALCRGARYECLERHQRTFHGQDSLAGAHRCFLAWDRRAHGRLVYALIAGLVQGYLSALGATLLLDSVSSGYRVDVVSQLLAYDRLAVLVWFGFNPVGGFIV